MGVVFAVTFDSSLFTHGIQKTLACVAHLTAWLGVHSCGSAWHLSASWLASHGGTYDTCTHRSVTCARVHAPTAPQASVRSVAIRPIASLASARVAPTRSARVAPTNDTTTS